MGISTLNEKLNDPDLREYFTGIFPRDHPQNSRFSINFFYSIGLNPLTQTLRDFLFEEIKTGQNETLAIQNNPEEAPMESSSDSESGRSDAQIVEEKREEVLPKESEKSREGGPEEDQKGLEERGEGAGKEAVNERIVEEGLDSQGDRRKDLLRNRSKRKKKKEKKKKKVKKRISKKKKKKLKKPTRKRKKSEESLEISSVSSASSLSDA